MQAVVLAAVIHMLDMVVVVVDTLLSKQPLLHYLAQVVHRLQAYWFLLAAAAVVDIMVLAVPAEPAQVEPVLGIKVVVLVVLN